MKNTLKINHATKVITMDRTFLVFVFVGLYALFSCRGQLGVIRADHIENKLCAQAETFDEAVAFGNVVHFSLRFAVGGIGVLSVFGQFFQKLIFLLFRYVAQQSSTISYPIVFMPAASKPKDKPPQPANKSIAVYF